MYPCKMIQNCLLILKMLKQNWLTKLQPHLVSDVILIAQKKVMMAVRKGFLSNNLFYIYFCESKCANK